MNIFRRLFGAWRPGNAGAALREVTAARQGAAGGLQISGRADADGNGAVLTIGTVEFEIFQDVGRLGDSIQRVGRGAMRMPTSVYLGVLRELMRTVSAVYGDESEQAREIVSAPLYCGTCGFAFPDSYKNATGGRSGCVWHGRRRLGWRREVRRERAMSEMPRERLHPGL